MAILKFRDANGNVQEILAIKGEDGKDYVLTEADKQEIAEIVVGMSQGIARMSDLSGYALKTDIPTIPSNVSAFTNDAGYLTETQVLELIAANMPVSAEEVKY